METERESEEKEELKEEEEEELKEEEEGPLYVSASCELLLKLQGAGSLPESYRLNSPSESRLLAAAGSFQRQYCQLFPSRKPLLLCLPNECGVQKFVSTALRPTPTGFPELFTWRGCASFVADFLSLEPLEPPVDLPRLLVSSSLVLQSQRASCLDSSTLLCSLLLGNNYDAYCVSGYAVREMCLLDRSALDCPLLDAQVQRQVAEQEPQESKYSVRPPKELRSRFVTQQEEQQQEAVPHLGQEQEREPRPADPLRGLRVHCWVLVLSGSRGVQENFFIDPLSGSCYATDHEHFLGVESVWNHLNYYLNMQDCSSGCTDMAFDLEDLKTWEPVLFGAVSKKQLLLDISKKKERKMMSNIIHNPEETQLKRRVFEMPRSWISPIRISKEDLENRWPGRQKVTRYRKAQLEEFSPYLRPSGLVQRLTAYRDLDCTEEVMVKEWYQHRDDRLEEREVNEVDSFTTERFKHGRPFHLLCHRFSSRSGERELLFSGAHVEGLVQRLLSPGGMTETFEGRSDFLFYRHTVLDPRVQFSGSDQQLDVQLLQEVVERFHRKRSKPANADVAERVFLLAQRRIEVTYHVEDHRFIASRRSFVVPNVSTPTKKAEDFTPDMVQSFMVDPSQEPLEALALSQILVDLMEDQNKLLFQIQESQKEVNTILTCRDQERQNVGLLLSPWTSTGAARARSQRQDMERQEAEEQMWLQRRKEDFLAPLLVRLDNPETLSAADARRLHRDALAECRQKLAEKAELIRKLCEEQTQELQLKQQWYQKNQGTLKQLQQDEYHDYCFEKTLRILVAQKRLRMHMEAAPLELQNFNLRLRNDPRLAPHLAADLAPHLAPDLAPCLAPRLAPSPGASSGPSSGP